MEMVFSVGSGTGGRRRDYGPYGHHGVRYCKCL